MERITISVDEKLAQEFDALVKKRGYTSRSEAIRDLLRRDVEANRIANEQKSYCVANQSYVNDHHARDLAERLMGAQHDRHDMVVSTMHVHLDHRHCLETVILKGPTSTVRSFADGVQAERGVRHANINVITVVPGDTHPALRGHRHDGHLHLIPRS